MDVSPPTMSHLLAVDVLGALVCEAVFFAFSLLYVLSCLVPRFALSGPKRLDLSFILFTVEIHRKKSVICFLKCSKL